ncbi:hypothetical protein BSKO_06862 [Bryopsis sp. KO-2023]|nr:hypothetical protein BSKO_06862 [Bryopsis sp. KO-2023]
MHAAVFAAVICSLAVSAWGQDNLLNLVREQLNGPAFQGTLDQIPTRENCRANAGIFMRACTEDLISSTSLKDDSAALIALVSINQENNSLRVKGGQLAQYIGGATTSDACCAAACEVARKGCMCDQNAFNAMVNAFDDANGSGGINAVFNEMVAKCTNDRRFFFEPIMDPNSEKCADAYAETAKTYTC